MVKKVAVATAERPLRRGSPQSMCPDVQPFDTCARSASYVRLAKFVVHTFVPQPIKAATLVVKSTDCGVIDTEGYLVTSSGTKDPSKG